MAVDWLAGLAAFVRGLGAVASAGADGNRYEIEAEQEKLDQWMRAREIASEILAGLESAEGMRIQLVRQQKSNGVASGAGPAVPASTLSLAGAAEKLGRALQLLPLQREVFVARTAGGRADVLVKLADLQMQLRHHRELVTQLLGSATRSGESLRHTRNMP